MKSSKVIAFFVAVLVILGSLAACGGNSSMDNSQSASAAVTTASSTTVAEPTADPFGKYTPSIELSTVRGLQQGISFINGENLDNNAWTKSFMDDLGIKINNVWTEPDYDQYNNKLNVSIASGDIPDFLDVNSQQFKSLINNNMVIDLTDLYNKYMAPYSKEVLTSDGGIGQKKAIVDGKMMGIGDTFTVHDGDAMLWIRNDWLKKLNLSAPKTMNDLIKVAYAFTKDDPDGNGKADTYGLAATKAIFGNWPGLDGFFNSYHAYHDIWVKDSSGSLVYGDILPEMKAALGQLQQFYKDGVLNKEFAIKDEGKVAEDITAGKVGMFYEAFPAPLWPLQDAMNKDSKADWSAYPLTSIDDKPALCNESTSGGDFYVVSNKCKNPEAVIKLINLYFKNAWGPDAKSEIYNTDAKGTPFCAYPPVFIQPADKNLKASEAVIEAMKNNDPSKLNNEQKTYYDASVSYRDTKDIKNWGQWGVFASRNGADGYNALELDSYYIQNNLIMLDSYYGLPSDNYLAKKTNADKVIDEGFTKIIMGSAPLSDFDKIVDQWKKVGGDDITKEVNDWAASQK